jgi:potassium-transporting ATPase potassium-binding subunit
MFIIWFGACVAAMAFEGAGNSALPSGVSQAATATSPGGNLEGKEVKFGPGGSGLWAASTTGTSNGSVNSMHDSFTPMGGFVTLAHMKMGEVSPGGVGVGLSGLLMMAILAVFIAGLMVGRTPEYLGKKIQAPEVKLVAIYTLIMPTLVLLFTAGSLFVQSVLDVSIYNPGAHGFSELLYAFTSAANNNGSAFGGLTGNTDWYNTTLGVTMLFGRFFLIVPVLAIAGSLARKQPVPATAGTFPTNTPLFAVLLVAVILTVVGLTYFPVVSLGPVLEHLTL